MTDRTSSTDARASRPGLRRELGLVGLAATGICSMLGAGINVIPFVIQRHVPGIGPWVLPAYAFAAVPAVLAALAYAMLASAMPRAGGSYVYASRGLSPYLGFVASFSQWFGLSIAIGVVSYVLVPFLRDVAATLEWTALAAALETGPVRVGVALEASAGVASASILGSHFAGDFFLGVDILVTSMLVNFLLMCLTVLTLPVRNAALADRVSVVPERRLQVPLAAGGAALLTLFLVVHVVKDLTTPLGAWYLHSTPLWLAVLGAATVVYLRETAALRRSGVDTEALFRELPPS